MALQQVPAQPDMPAAVAVPLSLLNQIENALEFHVIAGDDAMWGLLEESLEALRRWREGKRRMRPLQCVRCFRAFLTRPFWAWRTVWVRRGREMVDSGEGEYVWLLRAVCEECGGVENR